MCVCVYIYIYGHLHADSPTLNVFACLSFLYTYKNKPS